VGDGCRPSAYVRRSDNTVGDRSVRVTSFCSGYQANITLAPSGTFTIAHYKKKICISHWLTFD
jgi:hypothetical protein